MGKKRAPVTVQRLLLGTIEMSFEHPKIHAAVCKTEGTMHTDKAELRMIYSGHSPFFLILPLISVLEGF